ncbi:hypothetical protein ACFQBY_07855 [Promicromonospora citrea]|uniref:Secreted protein n=1 Tax=Promicromonospora citrea TaxID=43677 RepID=A0A8H9L6X6_9MICO|nr:hypothetical protein [Promicromonospora citrea]GGM32986.1 hypothetical protein GCM10010102_30620 [Promicromonospora citrea]
MFSAPRTSWRGRASALVAAFALALPLTAAATAPATAVPAAAATVQAAAAPAGSAATAGIGCGKRIAHKGIHAGGRRVAWLDVYDNRNTGAKCAVTVHTGPSWGVVRHTAVRLKSANLSVSTGATEAYRTNRVVLRGVDGVCVAAQGGISWGGKMRTTTVRGLCG